jgi:hypothetical protein
LQRLIGDDRSLGGSGGLLFGLALQGRLQLGDALAGLAEALVGLTELLLQSLGLNGGLLEIFIDVVAVIPLEGFPKFNGPERIKCRLAARGGQVQLRTRGIRISSMTKMTIMIEKSNPTPPTRAVGRIRRIGARTGSVTAARTCWIFRMGESYAGRTQLKRAAAISTMTYACRMNPMMRAILMSATSYVGAGAGPAWPRTTG